jgi:hypothetical protein
MTRGKKIGSIEGKLLGNSIFSKLENSTKIHKTPK